MDNRSKIRLTPLLSGIALCAAVALGACSSGGKVKNRAGPGERIAILANDNAIAVDPTLANVPVTIPPAQVNMDWAQAGGSATKSMGNLALGTGLTRLWEAKIAGGSKTERLGAEPVVADGRLYVMDVTSHVTAFDAATGRKIWMAPFGVVNKDKEMLYGGGVSVDGQTLYALNGVGDVGAMNVTDGSAIWTKRPGAPLRSYPAFAFGSLYVTSQDNQIIALNAADGEVLWSKAAPVQLATVFGASAPAIGQGTVVVGFSSGDLSAYRYENGRDLWQDTLTRTSVSTSVGLLADIDAAPVIDQGRLFAIGSGGRMVSLEMTTGQRLWELPISGSSTPWVAGDWVFVVTDDARLLCLARTTGRVRWQVQLDRYRGQKPASGKLFWHGPLLASDRLILVSSLGSIVSISPTDGTQLERVETKNSSISLPPIIANSTLYLLDDSGRLSAWRGTGGPVPVAAPVSASVPAPTPAPAPTPGQ